MKDLVSENIAFREDGKVQSLDVYAPRRVNMGIVVIVLIMMAKKMTKRARGLQSA